MAVILGILVVIAVIVIICYNSLTQEKNRIEMAAEELRKYEESGSEEDILNARKYLQAVLRDYNNKVETFPTSIVAEMFNFPKMHSEDFDEGL